MNIKLTADEAQFLRMLAAKQGEGAHDNLGTMTPIHVVERMYRTFVRGDSEEVWVDADRDAEYDTFEELIDARRSVGEPIPSYDDALYMHYKGLYILDKADYCKAFSISAYSGEYVYRYIPMAFFFVRAEAVRYMTDYQKHNCGHCRIYTYGLGYDNRGDMPVFRALLMRMGQQLLEETAPYVEAKAIVKATSDPKCLVDALKALQNSVNRAFPGLLEEEI